MTETHAGDIDDGAGIQAALPPGRRAKDLQRSWSSSVVDPVESMGWLDRVADAVAPLVDRALSAAGPQAADVLHGRPLGHALHPALSDLPIGLWAGSLLLDATGDSRGAGTLTAAGAGAAVAVAVTGTVDWTGTHGRERRLAMAHGLINTAALGLQLASLAARAGGGRRTARLLSLAGFSVSGAAAWLGGELVFGRGVMVDHLAWQTGPQDWTPVLGADELVTGRPVPVDVEGRRVLLYRDNGGVHAMENTCTHAGGPLSEGQVDSGVVTCPWHGSRFDLRDGSVVGGPATYPQVLLQTRVREGRIEVRGREG